MGAPSGPGSGLLSNIQEINCPGDTQVLTEQETLLGGDTQVESSGVREPRRTALPSGLQSWVMGSISGLSLSSQSDSGSFLVV